jgi:hypothetical protein
MNGEVVAWILTVGGIAGAISAVAAVIKKLTSPVNALVKRVESVERKQDVLEKTLEDTNKHLSSAVGERKEANEILFAALLSLIKRGRTGDGIEYLVAAEDKIHDYLVKH